MDAGKSQENVLNNSEDFQPVVISDCVISSCENCGLAGVGYFWVNCCQIAHGRSISLNALFLVPESITWILYG